MSLTSDSVGVAIAASVVEPFCGVLQSRLTEPEVRELHKLLGKLAEPRHGG